jgi:hypothetical protein
LQRLIVASALWLLFCASAQSEAALELVQTIPLPNIDGRIDHFAIDVKGQRAFLAALACMQRRRCGITVTCATVSFDACGL